MTLLVIKEWSNGKTSYTVKLRVSVVIDNYSNKILILFIIAGAHKLLHAYNYFVMFLIEE